MATVAVGDTGTAVKMVTVTPQMAQDLLGTQGGRNRNLDPNLVRKFVDDILEDRWGATSLLQVDAAGCLVDGQHRLQAVVKAARPVRFALATGVPPESFRSIDQGKPRSAAHPLTNDGHLRAFSLAAVLRWVWRYERAEPGRVPSANCYISTGVVYETLERHPGTEQSIALVGKYAKDLRPLVTETMVAFVHYMGSRTSPTKADDFVESLATTIGLTKDSPVRQLHRLLRTNASAQRKLRRDDMYAYCGKAWLCYEAGKPMNALKRHDSEPFPIFRFDKRPRPPK